MNSQHLTSSQIIAADNALKISRFISDIYHHTQGESTTSFGHKALALLVQLIDIDSAYWLVFSKKQPITIAIKFTYGLSKSEPNDINTKQLSELLEQINITTNNCFVISEDKLHKQSLFNQQYNINQQILANCNEGNIQHLIMLNRQNKTNAFKDSHIAILQFVMPLLAKAFEQNIESQLTRHWNYWRSDKAICDQQGNILFSQKGFINTLAKNLKDWDKRQLPTQIALSQLPVKLKYNDIKIDVFAEGHLIVAEAYQFDHQIESLTLAEKKIAELLLQALTNKQMAQTLKIKEKTIEHQVKSLCTKLDVTNRTEAVMILQNSDYRFNLP